MCQHLYGNTGTRVSICRATGAMYQLCVSICRATRGPCISHVSASAEQQGGMYHHLQSNKGHVSPSAEQQGACITICRATRGMYHHLQRNKGACITICSATRGRVSPSAEQQGACITICRATRGVYHHLQSNKGACICVCRATWGMYLRMQGNTWRVSPSAGQHRACFVVCKATREHVNKPTEACQRTPGQHRCMTGQHWS